MTRKKFQDLNLSNAYLFAATIQDEETCRITLSLLLGIQVKKVEVHAEHSLLYNSDCRTIHLDVYAGEDFNALGPNYIIFICCFDPFGKGLYRYTFTNKCTEECAGEQDDIVRQIHTRVATIKHDRSWESRYMRVEELMQQEYRKGIRQGIQQGTIQAQERLVRLMKCMQEAGEQDKISMLAEEGFLEKMFEKYNV